MPEMPPEQREQYDHLVETIDNELRAQNAGRDLGMSLDVIASLARAIADNIDYAFRYEWSPRWEQRSGQG
jgi:hypothetical protein